jgi:tRNA nucleotidyltransferase (CCA-adding enzyme)
MDVITTHLNADFDALGSMIAAKKIYPDAVLVFPGSQEKSLRRFFLESVFYLAPFEKIRKIDLKKVRRLILVDIRQRDRIGKFEEIVDRPDVEVHIYDHHPPTEHDIRGHVEHCRPVGATVSILVEHLRRLQVRLTPEEATILMLGIYEDTGCLTFGSTRVEDMEAAAYLLKSGADLSAVSHLITSELTQDQLVLLNELVQSLTTYHIAGVEVHLAEASADGYVGDLAALVHKLRDMENFNALFVLARMENRVFLVARSRLGEVDVGEIARAFGGGGHPTAASATIKDLTLFQARERLVGVLRESIRPEKSREEVRKFMSYPVISLQAEETVRQAKVSVSRYNVSSFPVLEGERLCGIITRQELEKATHHGLQDHRVSEFMNSDFITLTVGDPIEKAHDLLLGGGQRFIPVVDGDRIVGVLTRMEVIRSLARSLPEPMKERLLRDGSSLGSREKRITRLMSERLPPQVVQLLREVGRIGEGLKMNVYLVGGVVRDLLMRRDNLDIDVVVEGDGLLLAEKICEAYPARKRVHERFGTAKVIFPDGFRIDVATARLEYYEKPAALPNVEWSSLKLDLYRRDFTMNTLAVRVNPGSFGELVDFFGGQKDIKDRVIRVIQNMSFIEDPTRIFRALRFAERFDFSLGPQTKYLMKNAIHSGLPYRLDGRRLFMELQLILQEENPGNILERMNEMGLLKVIDPGLNLDVKLRSVLEQSRQVASWFRLLYLEEPWEEWLYRFLCLIAFLDEKALTALPQRLEIRSGRILEILVLKGQAEQALRKLSIRPHRPRPSRIYGLLHPLPVEILLYVMTKTPRETVRKAVSLYITRLRSVRISVSGEDLMDMGYPRGPGYREIFQRVMNARLDGQVNDLATEKEWISRHFPVESH